MSSFTSLIHERRGCHTSREPFQGAREEDEKSSLSPLLLTADKTTFIKRDLSFLEEHRLLKPFAVKLFRECLRVVDLRNNRDMLKELRDFARAARLITRKRVEERVNAE
jgi:hypothetical protein